MDITKNIPHGQYKTSRLMLFATHLQFHSNPGGTAFVRFTLYLNLMKSDPSPEL